MAFVTIHTDMGKHPTISAPRLHHYMCSNSIFLPFISPNQLTTLHIDHCPCEPWFLPHLSDIPSLDTIHFERVWSAPDTLESPARLPSLRSIKFTECHASFVTLVWRSIKADCLQTVEVSLDVRLQFELPPAVIPPNTILFPSLSKITWHSHNIMGVEPLLDYLLLPLQSAVGVVVGLDVPYMLARRDDPKRVFQRDDAFLRRMEAICPVVWISKPCDDDRFFKTWEEARKFFGAP